ncbi:MAG: universal stress protein [Ignavibacteriales bacterium]
MSNRILVPYDDSEYSNKAVRHTIKYAKSFSKDAEIILMYVVPEIHLPPSYDYGMKISDIKTTKEYRKELYQQMKMRALEMLNRKKDEFKDAGINNVRTQISIGNPIEKILDLAFAEKVDLIIIGSIGLGGISKLRALGSVSRSVSERAKCPVLIVR